LASKWHVVQVGCPAIGWQVVHVGGPGANVPWKAAVLSLFMSLFIHPVPWVPAGTAAPWQSVLLKQPGAVPAGAGGLGGATGEFWPFAWQKAQTEAFPSFTTVCV
jgi:hypothetical protein